MKCFSPTRLVRFPVHQHHVQKQTTNQLQRLPAMDWFGAMSVVSDALVHHEPLTVHHYNALLTTIARSNRGEQIEKIETQMVESRIRPDSTTTRLLMLISLKNGDWANAIDILSAFRTEHDIPFDTGLMSMAMRACGVGGCWDVAIDLFRQMPLRTFFDNPEMPSTLMKILHNEHKHKHVVRLGQLMNSARLRFDDNVLAMVFSACERQADWGASVQLLQQLWSWESERRISSQVIGCVLRAVSVAGKHHLVDDIYDAVRVRGSRMNEDAFHAVAMAAYVSESSQVCLGIVQDAVASFVPLYSTTYDVILKTLQKKQKDVRYQWSAWNALLRHGVSPNDASMTMFLERCTKGWEAAMRLLPTIRAPSGIMHIVLLHTLCTAGRWVDAFQLLETTEIQAPALSSMIAPPSSTDIIPSVSVLKDFQTLTLPYDMVMNHSASWRISVEIFRLMKLRKVSISTETISSLCEVALRNRNALIAGIAVNELKTHSFSDREHHTEITLKVLRTAAVCGQGNVTHKTVNYLSSKGVRMDIDLANLILHACQMEGKWDEAVRIWQAFPTHGLAGDETTVRILSNICYRASWHVSTWLIEKCEKLRLPETSLLYRASLSRTVFFRQWEASCVLHNSMAQKDIACTSQHFQKMICMFSSEDRWRESLNVYRRMTIEGVPSTSTTWAFIGIGIMKSQQWSFALNYLQCVAHMNVPRTIVEAVNEIIFTQHHSPVVYRSMCAAAKLEHLDLRIRFSQNFQSSLASDIVAVADHRGQTLNKVFKQCYVGGDLKLALKIFQLSCVEGVTIDPVWFAKLSIQACSQSDSSEIIVRLLQMFELLDDGSKKDMVKEILFQNTDGVPMTLITKFLEYLEGDQNEATVRTQIVRNLLRQHSQKTDETLLRSLFPRLTTFSQELYPHFLQLQPFHESIHDVLTQEHLNAGKLEHAVAWALTRSPYNLQSLSKLRERFSEQGLWEKAVEIECYEHFHSRDNAKDLSAHVSHISSWRVAAEVFLKTSVSTSFESRLTLLKLFCPHVSWMQTLQAIQENNSIPRMEKSVLATCVTCEQGLWYHSMELFHQYVLPRNSAVVVVPVSNVHIDEQTIVDRLKPFGTILAVKKFEDVNRVNSFVVRYLEEDAGMAASQYQQKEFVITEVTRGRCLAVTNRSKSMSEKCIEDLLVTALHAKVKSITPSLTGFAVKLEGHPSCGLLAVLRGYPETKGLFGNSEVSVLSSVWNTTSPKPDDVMSQYMPFPPQPLIIENVIRSVSPHNWMLSCQIFSMCSTSIITPHARAIISDTLLLRGRWSDYLACSPRPYSEKDVATLMEILCSVGKVSIAHQLTSTCISSTSPLLASVSLYVYESCEPQACIELYQRLRGHNIWDARDHVSFLLASRRCGITPVITEAMIGVPIGNCIRQAIEYYLTGSTYIHRDPHLIAVLSCCTSECYQIVDRCIQYFAKKNLPSVCKDILSKFETSKLPSNVIELQAAEFEVTPRGHVALVEQLLRHPEPSHLWSFILTLNKNKLSGVFQSQSKSIRLPQNLITAIANRLRQNPPQNVVALFEGLNLLGVSIHPTLVENFLKKMNSLKPQKNLDSEFEAMCSWACTNNGIALLWHQRNVSLLNALCVQLVCLGRGDVFGSFLQRAVRRGYSVPVKNFIQCAISCRTEETINEIIVFTQLYRVMDDDSKMKKLLGALRDAFEVSMRTPKGNTFLLHVETELMKRFIPKGRDRMYFEKVVVEKFLSDAHAQIDVTFRETKHGLEEIRRYARLGLMPEACRSLFSMIPNFVVFDGSQAYVKQLPPHIWYFSAIRRRHWSVPVVLQCPPQTNFDTFALRNLLDSTPTSVLEKLIQQDGANQQVLEAFFEKCYQEDLWQRAFAVFQTLPLLQRQRCCCLLSFSVGHAHLKTLLEKTLSTAFVDVSLSVKQMCLEGHKELCSGQDRHVVFANFVDTYLQHQFQAKNPALETYGMCQDYLHGYRAVKTIQQALRVDSKNAWAISMQRFVRVLTVSHKFNVSTLKYVLNSKDGWRALFQKGVATPGHIMSYLTWIMSRAWPLFQTATRERIAFLIGTQTQFTWEHCLGIASIFHNGMTNKIATEIVCGLRWRRVTWDRILSAYVALSRREECSVALDSSRVVLSLLKTIKYSPRSPLKHKMCDVVMSDLARSMKQKTLRQDATINDILTAYHHAVEDNWGNAVRVLELIHEAGGLDKDEVEFRKAILNDWKSLSHVPKTFSSTPREKIDDSTKKGIDAFSQGDLMHWSSSYLM
eukprot:PhF_6_TR17082/c0_g1_i1/m.26221